MTAVHQLLEIARRMPQRPAVHCRDGQVLSYAELVGRASALAHQLRVDGVQRDRNVILEVEPTLDWAIGAWGIWLANGVLSPVDPANPPVRRRLLRDAIAATASVTVTPTHEAPVNATWLPRLSDRAWLIHSSGSTGHPKGIVVDHRGVPALLEAQRKAFGLHPRARVLAVLSPAFDASLSDLMTTHTSGACLVIAPRGVLSNPDLLIETLTRHRITHVDLPPSVVSRICPSRLPASLETVIMGGEICPLPAARAWAQRVRLVSVYGPTEATICTSMIRIDPDRWSAPEIGSPIPGVSYRIEDRELWIGGDCLARGYTDPELTDQRFVEDNGTVWFRSGDRVEHRDGRWIFHGRCDRMAKLGGRLAHPEELEHVLATHPDVKRATAWVRHQRLHAAVVGDGDPETLRTWLRDRVPAWMVPATISIQDQLPVTSTGKIDLRATQAMQLLPALWSKSLDRPVHLHDDLDALGRDSLAVLEVCALAEEAGLHLRPEIIGDAPTCAEIMRRSNDPMRSIASLIEQLPTPELRPPRNHRKPQRILLTGATGRLGRAVLPELLEAGLTVVALIRPGSEFIPHPRLQTIIGDLRLIHMGLTDELHATLADCIDTVVHLAAELHSLSTAQDLWATNVIGTQQVLNFAATGCPKRVHHASTLAVLACSDLGAGVVNASTPLPDSGLIHGGYAQTKWAAEYLANAAGACVHRLGHLVEPGAPGLLRQVIRGMAALDLPRPTAQAWCNLTSLHAAAQALCRAVLIDQRDRTHLVAPAGFSLIELTDQVRGRSFTASQLEKALAYRTLLAPHARHPSNIFLSTGWSWGGDLAQGATLERHVELALEAA